MSTRPRTKFDERGWCNGCQWMEEKKTINWQARQDELKGVKVLGPVFKNANCHRSQLQRVKGN